VGDPLPQHLRPSLPLCLPSFQSTARPFSSAQHSLRLHAPSLTLMARQQPITVLDPLPWPRSTVTRLTLSELVNAGQLAENVDGQPTAWIVPPSMDREYNPPRGYVVSFICFHERGLRRRRAASCAGCATTTAWSCTT
jgi:hypothetical protein